MTDLVRRYECKPTSDKRAIGFESQNQRKARFIVYESAMYDSERWHRNKVEQRARILAVMADVIPESDVVKMLSLPGSEWTLERQVTERWRYTRIVGCENAFRTFERSLAHLPRESRLKRFIWNTQIGKINVAQADRDGRYCTIFNADIGALMSGALHPLAWLSDTQWNRYSRHFNAIIIDGVSPLGCEPTLRNLRSLREMSDVGKQCALSLTFTIGRDDTELARVFRVAGGDSLNNRADFIKEYLAANGVDFTILDTMQHSSASDESSLLIGTVIGTYRVAT